MKPFFLLLTLLMGNLSLAAYDKPFLNLIYSLDPETDFRGDLEFSHRFYLFTEGTGANIWLKGEGILNKTIVHSYQYETLGETLSTSIGLQNRYAGWGLGFQILGSLDRPLTQERSFSPWGLVHLQSPHLLERVTAQFNGAWVPLTGLLTMGLGLNIQALPDWGVILEGYPGANWQTFGYQFGIWHSTAGHQFIVTGGNVRPMDLKGIGSGEHELGKFYFGFILRRKNDFYPEPVLEDSADL